MDDKECHVRASTFWLQRDCILAQVRHASLLFFFEHVAFCVFIQPSSPPHIIHLITHATLSNYIIGSRHQERNSGHHNA